jgi:hypothetical protein
LTSARLPDVGALAVEAASQISRRLGFATADEALVEPG